MLEQDGRGDAVIPATLWGHFSNPAELPIWKETEATSQHAALGQAANSVSVMAQ